MFFLRTRMTREQKQTAKGTEHRTITFATWNVRTLVENAGGDRRICRSRARPGPDPQVPYTSGGPHYVDRKLDFLVKELRRLGVAIAGIQETKWFGNAVVLPTLLYGAETWTVKADSVRRMRGFHNRCIRSMLGVSRLQQWKERIT